MSEMLDKGFTLAESLDFLGRMNRQWVNMFQSMTHLLQAGQPIYEVFNEHGFDRQTCTQLYFAEKHGFIADALKESGNHLLRKEEQQKKLLRLLQYPLILVIVFISVSVLLQVFLLPRFQSFYHSMGYSPNVFLKSFLHIMQSLPLYSLFSLFIMLSVTFLFTRLIYRKSALEKALFFSKFPFVRTYYKLYQTTFLAREWSFLLKSGFSINEITKIMLMQDFHPLLKESSEEIGEMLKYGYSFSEAVSHLGFIEEELMVIVAHGEQNGKLESELLFYSQFCLHKLEEKTMKAFIYIQPVIFGLIGLMIVAVYLSIFLPMFQVIESI